MRESVSIICPTYNASAYIAETLESILNQSYQFWELILIDGGSSDNTIRIIETFVEKDSRIQLFSFNKVRGPGAARRFGLSKAVGDYYAFIDSDDLWLPFKLERQISFMNSQRLDFTYSYYDFIHGDTIKEGPSLVSRFSGAQYFSQRGIANSSVILRASRVKSVAQTFSISGFAEDTGLWLKLLLSGVDANLFPEVTLQYRVHSAQRSATRVRNLISVYHLYHDIFGLKKSVSFVSVMRVVVFNLTRRFFLGGRPTQ